MNVRELIDKLKEVDQNAEVIVSIADFEHDFEWSNDEPAQIIRESITKREVEIIGGRVK